MCGQQTVAAQGRGLALILTHAREHARGGAQRVGVHLASGHGRESRQGLQERQTGARNVARERGVELR